jgi:peptidyl-prolyl cis-trans isomerase C
MESFFYLNLKGFIIMKFPNTQRRCQLAAVLALILAFVPAIAQETQSTNKNAAMVNGVAISMEQYNKELNIQLDRVTRQGQQVSDEQMAKLKNNILDNLIEREILYQQSQKDGIQITDQKVDDQLASIKKRFPNETEFKNALDKMNLTEDEVKSQIKRGLSIRELIDQKITSKVVITDEESKAYYDKNPQMFKQPAQIKASHILIKVDAKADETKKAEARKKIEEVQQKLKDGGDFATLAKEYSEGPSNAKGGDLGYFRRGQMVKPFEDAAMALKPNEVSDIVETRFGYHLIKVYDSKPEETLAYADVKDKIAQRMKQEKVEEEAVQYVDQLKKDAKLEKFI